MTPQSTFMVVAPIADGRRAELEALLTSMNSVSCMADPANGLVPFGSFDRLHFARFVILDPQTLGDIGVYGGQPPPWTASLAFLGDCDGDADSLVDELVAQAEPGLRRIFSHCRNFGPTTDLRHWMLAHTARPTASYVNWIGRTVRQIREEAALREALIGRARELGGGSSPLPPARLRDELLEFVRAETAARRLTLSPEEPTPPDWRARNLAHLIGVPLVLLVLAPFLVIASPVLLFLLRSRESSDPEITPRLPRERVSELAAQEDHDFTNQFSAMGDVKPGRFRRWLVVALLRLLDYASRHIFRRGYLTRVQTIHFARWVLLDDDRRLLFASSYDGSLESYMDDFINKVAWGINVVFGNGVGFPRVSWLFHGGAGVRGQVQALPAPPPDPDAGLVQGLSRPLGRGPESQHTDPSGRRPSARRPGRDHGLAEPPLAPRGTASMAQAIEVDYGDIQGLARFGHGRLEEACYLLVRVADREAAREWLRTAPVTTAVTMTPAAGHGPPGRVHQPGPGRAGRLGMRDRRLLRRVPHRHGGGAQPLATAR